MYGGCGFDSYLPYRSVHCGENGRCVGGCQETGGEDHTRETQWLQLCQAVCCHGDLLANISRKKEELVVLKRHVMEVSVETIQYGC